MHIEPINIILGAVFFLIMSVAECIAYYKKQEDDISSLMKKILMYFAIGIFICIFTTF